MEIENHAAIVTGAGSGLGAATARALAAAGARVSVFDLNLENARKVAKEIGGLGIACDVRDVDSAIDAIDVAESAHGVARIIVNCAGIAQAERVLGRAAPIALERHNNVVDIHLNGTFNIIRLTADRMQKLAPVGDGERGIVVNTASIAAFEGQIGAASYAAAKAGIAGLTLPLAREFSRYGIRVMAIAPGLFDTEMAAQIPTAGLEKLQSMLQFPKRFGDPREFASLVIDICRNRMLNGEVIRLDGCVRLALG